MQVAVFGAGAVGGWIGGAWASAGIEVMMIGRRAVAEEIGAHGITISDGSGEGPARSIHLPAGTITASTDAKSVADADLILVTVKSPATEEAARAIKRHARKGAVVVSFQNGVTNAETLAAALPDQIVLAGMCPFNVARLGNGRFHKGTGGDLMAADHPLLREIAEKVGTRPGRLRLVEDMKPVLWSKLLLNLNNAVNALSGKTLVEELSDPDYRAVLAATMDEALLVMKLIGVEPAKLGLIPPKQLPNMMRLPGPLFRAFLKAQKIGPDARSSMADDFEAGRATEIDYLNGAIVEIARRHGRNPKVNAAIVALVKEVEAGVDRRWSGKDLRARVMG